MPSLLWRVATNKQTNTMKAIGKNIIVTAIHETVKTETGILLSGEDLNQMRYGRAIVESPGTDVHTINVGDEVYFDKTQSYTMLIHDNQYTIIQERDVVVVL